MPTVTITFNDPATILVTSPAADAPVSPASAPSTGEDPVASHPGTAASPAAVSGDRLEQEIVNALRSPALNQGITEKAAQLASVARRTLADERPWYDDPREIAALWRWLVSRSDQPGGSEAYFIENAHEWLEDRECMVRKQGRVTSE